MDLVITLLRRYLKAAWRRRWLGLGITWVVCVLGWIGVWMVPNQYMASARLYVNSDAVLTPLLKGLAVDPTSSQLNVLQATLLSRPNIESVIAKTDLDLTVTTPGQRDALISNLASHISVRGDPRLNLFSIQYSDPNPQLARDVVQTLLNIYVENATGGNRRDMENARIFLQHQIASYEQQLRVADQRKAEFRARYPAFFSLGMNGANGADTLKQQIQQIESAIQDKSAATEAFKKELASISPNVVTEQGGGPGAPMTLESAERNLRMLRLKYTDQYPGVIAAQKVVDSFKADPLKGRGGVPGQKSTPNPLYVELKGKLVDTTGQISGLQRQLATLQQNLTKVEEVQREWPNLTTEYENMNRGNGVLRKNYEELVARLQSANIGEAADTQANKVQIRVVDPPVIPRVPYSPNRLLLISGVLLAGIIAGLAIPMMLSQFDKSFWVVEDLRALGLPVLGGISLLSAPKRRHRVTTAASFGVAVIVLIGLYGGLVLRILRATTAV